MKWSAFKAEVDRQLSLLRDLDPDNPDIKDPEVWRINTICPLDKTHITVGVHEKLGLNIL